MNMTVTTERLILGGLVQDDNFVRQTIPFLQPEYFHDKIEQAVFDQIKAYLDEYKTLPNRTALLLDIREHKKLNEREVEQATDVISDLYTVDIPGVELKWLVKQAEEFCQNKAVYNAIIKAISIYDGTEKDLTAHVIPDMIRDAISISFDAHIGQDIFEDAESRFDYYTQPENKISFDLEILNRITNGGVGKKTLNLFVAGVNVGKTMALCHLASAYMKSGYNVLYVSLEMGEEEILRRVDANTLRVSINKLAELGKEEFVNRVDRLKQKTHGVIKVKQFPTGAGSVAHFKHVLNELKLKKRFVPDVIVIDYIGIAASSRIKMGQHNSYTYLKAVAEEFRALAIETDTVVWTAMQLNRQGISSSDVEITDVSDSMGIPATADLMLSLSRTEELDSLNQLLVKQLKNRYGNRATDLRFVIGVDLEKQTLYDVNNQEQADLVRAESAIASDSSRFKSKFSTDGFKV